MLQARHSRSAASATSSCSGLGSAVASRCWSSCPGFASTRETAASGCLSIHPKISVDAASAPTPASKPSGAAEMDRRTRREQVADRRRDEQRPDEVRAAALVLLPALLAVLVRPDRDVLGSVVRGELGRAQSDHRGQDGEEPAHELPRSGVELRIERTSRTATAPAPIAAATTGSSNGNFASGIRRLSAGRTAKASTSRAGPRSSGCSTFAALKPLYADSTRSVAVRQPDGAGPRRGPVHEHAVRKRHSSEADLLLGHALRIVAGRG